MNANTLLVESPVVFYMLDNSERGSAAAAAVLMLNAVRGRFTEEAEEDREESLPDLWMSPADWDAWEDYKAEAAAEDAAVWAYLDRMQDEEDDRNQFWD